MKKNIKEYKEKVNIVADIQEYLERTKEAKEREIERCKEYKDNKEDEYYQEYVKQCEMSIKAINEVINELEKLL